ncbi:unnamed protein product [Cuscuta campestris]|uniref:Fungal lipase-type domain-containing protein n=1 Tax=Cuscuta campestris TaxID=132261 RepID=A0A484K1R6_9ASTE|nr:unnamed protein product [Cuscuta campestris]
MDSPCLQAVIRGVAPPIGSFDVRASNPSQVNASAVIPAESPPLWISHRNSHRRRSYNFRPCVLLPARRGGPCYNKTAMAGDGAVSTKEELDETKIGENRLDEEGENGNWVMKILRVRSLGRKNCRTGDSDAPKMDGQLSDENQNRDEDDCDPCAVDDDDNEEDEFDRNSFSKLLWRVSLKEARFYDQMSYLGTLAYSIPQIKPRNLLGYHKLRFVTSSLEKKEQALKAERETRLAEERMKKESEVASSKEAEVDKKEDEEERNQISGNGISASAAYRIAASAASYLQHHTKNILPFKNNGVSCNGDTPRKALEGDGNEEEVASLMATTDSVTSVVAAREEVKQAVADDLSSTRLSPCEWFVCDDDKSGTRFFAIQGSESLASWQANLLFEPTQFEGMDIVVHRGIYEAAKGMYAQMLPEVRAHLKSYGPRASFRFTGHSLGGSLSLLINLMLLMRGDAPRSSLLPIITFGSPNIMCGGDRLLQKLGLPQSHVQSIMMHRDIVPRAFSCTYPHRVAEFLKAVNGSFRNHPCLNDQKLLYASMGELLILQPDDNFSPSHPLLPSGPGLYILSCPINGEAEKQIQAAKTAFLNSPHPLEILSDRSAYGSGGTVQRDHDMHSYRKSIRTVIRKELRRIRRARRNLRHKMWWPAGIFHGGIVLGKLVGPAQYAIGGIFHGGKESMKRLTLVASRWINVLLVFLIPAPLLLLRALRHIAAI